MEAKEIKELFGNTKTQYENLNQIKESLDGTWEDCAALTLPYIYPPDSTTALDELPTPFNSVGPSAVNALASKLLTALIPPTGPFFRLLPYDEIQENLSPDELHQLDKELSDLEQQVVEELNVQGLRVPLFEAMKLLIVTGNALILKVPKKGLKVFSPQQYVVKRDFVGNLNEIIIKETMSYVSLPEKVKQQLEESEEPLAEGLTEEEKDINLKPVDVYTRIHRKAENNFLVWQEIRGIVLEDTIKEYSKDLLPYVPLRWSTINNEDYGRGLVEQYLGDLRSLEGLTQTIVEGSGIAAQFLFGLRPGSTLKPEDLNNAQNGEFVLGDLEREVSVLQVNKGPDLQVPFSMMEMLQQRISQAFLMLQGNIRDSERTTAVEVRATISELESVLGGVYSVLASELQQPLIRLLLQEMAPSVLKVSEISITTGISAISRERDFQNLNTMAQVIGQFGPEVMQRYLNMGAYFAQVATALGMDAGTIVKSEEQIAQEEQQQMAMQQQMMAEQEAMKAQGQMAVNQSKG
jgi:hypothetical protein